MATTERPTIRRGTSALPPQLKLLVYSHYFSPRIGGVETIVLSLARGLAAARTLDGFAEFDVTLVTKTPCRDLEDRLFPFRILRNPGMGRLIDAVYSSDVVHVAGPAISPIVLGFLMRKPVVVEHHGFQAVCPNGQLLMEPAGVACPGHFMAGRYGYCLGCRPNSNWRSSWKLWLLTFVRRFLCRRVSVNIVPTQWLGGLLQLPNTQPIPHGIEINSAGSAFSPSQPFRIIFQGRLVSTKGVSVLLEAAAILQTANRSFEILVVGDGPERETLQNLAQKLRLSTCVHFLGPLAPAALESTLISAGVVVVPSLGGEVFGLVLAENMARGLPIIASDLGAFQEVLGGEGLTFTSGDAKDLANQLSLLMDNPAVAAGLARGARKRVSETYPQSRMVEEHARVYRALYATTSSHD
jgi:glycogen synthase